MNNDYFHLYFSDSSFFSKKKIKILYEGFVKYFTQRGTQDSQKWLTTRVLEVSIKDISTGIDRQMIEKSLINYPKSVLSALSMAAHYSYHNNMLPFGTLYHVSINDWKSPIKHICELKSELVGCFIRVRGIIQCSTIISSRLIECQAKCLKCGKTFFLSDSKKICPDCKNKSINIITDDNLVIQYQQRFIMKDIILNFDHNFTLNCDIKGEMVDSIRLGEIVDVTGILKFDEKKNKANQSDRNFTLLLDVNYVNKLQYTKGGYASSYIKVNDGEMIQSLGNIKEIFPILINSFCAKNNSSSNIHPMIKAALMLSIFSTPCDPVHILLSKYFDDLFSCIYRIVPHSVIFNEASINKLTSTITKAGSSSSSPSKAWFIGGSFVEANQGLLMVNDIDRFKAAQETFLEIVELGWERVDSLHKISTNFSSIIIADPKSLNKTVLNNAFTMKFELDDELTNSLTSYVTTPRSSAAISQNSSFQSFPDSEENDDHYFDTRRYEQWNNSHLTLAEKLSIVAEIPPNQNTKSLGIIGPDIFLKYVTYAKQFVKPKWSKEAVEKLKDVTSSTTKDLLAIRNMAQCRARIDLRNKVEASDVVDCAEILEWSRSPPHDKQKQVKKNINCRGNSKQKMIIDFMNEFKKIAGYKENGIVDEKEMKEIADMLSITSKFYSFEHFMETLTMNNLVLLSGPKKYRVGSTL